VFKTTLFKTTLRTSLLLRRDRQHSSPFNNPQNKAIEGLESLCINHGKIPPINIQSPQIFMFLSYIVGKEKVDCFLGDFLTTQSAGWLIIGGMANPRWARYGISIIANKGWDVKWRQTSGPGPYL
jgi:hypothetical protein